jgi:hypothetical protein
MRIPKLLPVGAHVPTVRALLATALVTLLHDRLRRKGAFQLLQPRPLAP